MHMASLLPRSSHYLEAPAQRGRSQRDLDPEVRLFIRARGFLGPITLLVPLVSYSLNLRPFWEVDQQGFGCLTIC